MKPRVQIDSLILSFIIILTGLWVVFPFFYFSNPLADDIFDSLGLLLVLVGIYFRMAGRGHKKFHSQEGHALVMSGPYLLVRNPMYLGSFLMGAGFLLMVWPWWMLPIFTAVFYMRFFKQIVREEELLLKNFGQPYADYRANVPRLFPMGKGLQEVDFKKAFPLKEAFSTAEKRGLLGWPILAFSLETFQEKFVFGFTNPAATILKFLFVMFVFTVGLLVLYNTSNSIHVQNSK